MAKYWKNQKGEWWLELPNGVVATLSPSHEVTEHEDGTITVWPSIIESRTGWHGWLKKGIFTEDYHSIPD